MTIRHHLSAFSLASLAFATALPLALPSTALAQNTATRQRTAISSFEVEPAERLRPGEVLSFTVNGTPGAKASVRIAGAATPAVLNETRPGVYSGEYTIRRQDRLSADSAATARLVKNGQWAEVPLNRTLLAGAQRQGQVAEVGDFDSDRRTTRAPAACIDCGRVVSVSQVDVDGNSKNIIGSVAGGVLGGVLGHQVGGGTGKDLATVIGAVGGAYAGNRIQNNADKKRVHRVEVRMDNGDTRSFDYADDPQVQPGNLVRVDNGVLHRR